MKYWRKRSLDHKNPKSNSGDSNGLSTLFRLESQSLDHTLEEHRFYQNFINQNKIFEVKITSFETVDSGEFLHPVYIVLYSLS